MMNENQSLLYDIKFKVLLPEGTVKPLCSGTVYLTHSEIDLYEL